MDRLNILYRGPLSSCNYDCHYCPFAKRRESASELRVDRECLERFLRWLEPRTHRPHGLFFTPWGEALVRPWYRDAIVEASHWPQTARVAIQTNLSPKLDWLNAARRDRVALWCTYHPGETSSEKFLEQCETLEQLKVKYSVGTVGLTEHAEEIESLRRALPSHIYLWINAAKSTEPHIANSVAERFRHIDPLYPINRTAHASFGKACDTGESAISVDGEGNVRRCHFVEEKLGNLYESELETLLKPRPCPNSTCGCHIGYVHMPEMKLKPIFDENILERIPSKWPSQREVNRGSESRVQS